MMEPKNALVATRVPTAHRRAAVKLDEVTVSFTDREGRVRSVLKDLSLHVPEGQFVALVGRSGGGKTTLLNVISGVVDPTAGEVQVLDSTPARVRRLFGLMPARDALMPWRTARRNVEYGLELRGVTKAERRATALKYLEMVGLADAVDSWPWQLSQGMRQRVSLARALALEPTLLLMDEPFAALDAQTRDQIHGRFSQLLAEHRPTVVLVTHDLEEAIRLADRVVVLGGGRIIGDLSMQHGLTSTETDVWDNPAAIEAIRHLRGLLRD